MKNTNLRPFKGYLNLYKMNYISKIVLYCTILSIASCVNYKKTLYFQGTQDQVKAPDPKMKYGLRSGDVILVKLFAPDPVSSEMFDIGTKGNSMVSPASLYMNGYSVNDTGYVDLPLAGLTYVKGYTLDQVDSVLSVKVKEYFSYFTLEVKLGSFKITTLGEVNMPGVHYIFNNKCTIFEAIAWAGDATDIANKHKVKVVRKMPDSTDRVYHLNLTDFSVYESEAYYMQPNDMIYIQPQRAKTISKNIQYVSLAFASISMLILLTNYVNTH
jgi:polysaccharide export outer membrane protein